MVSRIGGVEERTLFEWSQKLQVTVDGDLPSGNSQRGQVYIVTVVAKVVQRFYLLTPCDAILSFKVNMTKFPDGMAALADYVHSKALYLGIYTAVRLACRVYTQMRDLCH